MIEIKENVDIKSYTTFKIGGQFRYFTEINSVLDLTSLYTIASSDEKYKNLPIFILGGGSNTILPDGVFECLALKINISLFEVVEDMNEYAVVKVGSGEKWDNFVQRVVELGLSGVESLSAIPGTVGATPVQNVGAYGAEVKDTITSVEVFNIEKREVKNLSNQECNFGYRDSIFKNEAKGKYIITAVYFKLSKKSPNIPDYPGVKKYFIENNINNPSLKDIREAIINIRQEKLPNPKELPNAGSFFKNPIVSKDVALKIKDMYEDLKTFPAENGLVKIPAGWLIENSGLKGRSFGKISVYDKNALILINNGEATQEDLVKAKNEIIKIVKEKFGVTLEQEPEIL